jgi:hypothetical protein
MSDADTATLGAEIWRDCDEARWSPIQTGSRQFWELIRTGIVVPSNGSLSAAVLSRRLR